MERCRHGMIEGQCGTCAGHTSREVYTGLTSQIEGGTSLKAIQQKMMKGKPMEYLDQEADQLEVETKVCRRCEKRFPITQFRKNPKSHDGHNHICERCQSEKFRASFPKTTKKRKLELPPGRLEFVKPKSNKLPIIIDLEVYPDLLNNLKESAVEHIRTIEYQVLAYIVKGLKDDGYPKDQTK